MVEPGAPQAVRFVILHEEQAAAADHRRDAVVEQTIAELKSAGPPAPEDRDRCTRAGVPDEVGFATKPQHGLAMLARAQAAGVLTGWVTADEAYGQHPTFRTWLAEREVPFVLATRNDDVLVSPDGHRR